MLFKKRPISTVFLFECNNTRDINQFLNGECPYRHNQIDYYMTAANSDGYEKVMSIDMMTAYAQPSRKVQALKSKAMNIAAKRNPGCHITVLHIDPRAEVPVMERIREAIRYHECTTRTR